MRERIASHSSIVSERPSDFIVAYHALLIGASPLLPIPIVDEFLATFFWRRMVSELAARHDKQLTDTQVRQFASRGNSGCTQGCIFPITFLIKEIFREIFFWLELRHGIDLATDAYYSGTLLNMIFGLNEFDPTKVVQYNAAIERAKDDINVELVKTIFGHTFRSSRGILRATLQWLRKLGVFYLKFLFQALWLKIVELRTDSPKSVFYESALDDINERMSQVFQDTQPKTQELVDDLTKVFQGGIRKVPREHFVRLEKNLFAELRQGGLLVD